MTGIFQEVVEPERIVFTSGAPTTVTFVEKDGKTKLTMRARVIKSTSQSAPHSAGMEQGWTQSLERLTSYLALQAKE